MPARSSFEVTFLYGENAFRSFAQAHPKGPAQTEYWVEVKLEDGTIVPSDHKNLTSAQPQPGNRPKLILLDQGVSINPDGGTCFFFTVKNVGDVSVKKADFSFVIQTERLAKPPVVQHESTSQPIIEGTQRTIRYSFPKVDPEPAYIAFYISYIEDGQETRWDSPPVFLVWRGVKENVVHLELEYLRDEEINRFKEYLRKHELPKPLL